METQERCPACQGEGWLGTAAGNRLTCQLCDGTKEVVMDRASVFDNKLAGW